MISPRHYYVVHGWMISELGLKGNALIAYAIIYGFSQDGASEYLATANYLASWMGCDKRTVLRTLKHLVEKGLLVKREYVQDGVGLCAYKACPPPESTSPLPPCQNVTGGGDKMSPGACQNVMGGGDKMSPGACQNVMGGGDKMSPSNNVDKEYIKNIISIVDYLNEKAGTRYQARGKDTQKHIRARLAEGFEVEQFKIVIDKKCAQWRNDPKMAEYLRPSTLFGTKFESYLNAPAPGGSAARGPNGIRIDQTKTDLDGIF